jgi:uncharacterized membrane protein
MKRYLGFVLTLLLVPAIALAARDLTSATNAAVSQASSVAKAASVLGILVGAVVYQVPGAAAWGQRVMASGFIGAGLAFGGPSFLGFLRTVFGG